MNPKHLTSAALLLFVVASIAILVAREMRQPSAYTTAAAASLPANGLVVYYFHGETRCPTCRNIESYAHEAVQSAFADELAQQKMVWKVVNYEQPENSHFATEYEIVAPTVVLVRTADEKVAEWRNLSRVWELVGEPSAFAEYVQNETRSLLGS